ncbi:alpha-galactosidase [Luteipulveratus mongoliensis]|uniref:Alpha-galactosidase n=1 Tax=Luteipulveratus mongoliensis TaxID=571913 RepID=A0A0K1JIC0_9MICO|nr:alpha-galactosidase [Luteipulveratus mongoliensis]AKU16451.1 alpha-galactosidase [Luteipulveratus mongoliensis]
MSNDLIHWRDEHVSILVDLSGPALPRILHWGADLGHHDDTLLEELADTVDPQRVSDETDDLVVATVLPLESAGWVGEPGLSGHRSGRDFAPKFVRTDPPEIEETDDVRRITVRAADAEAHLELIWTIEMLPGGLVRQRNRVTNTGTSTYELTGLLCAYPVPSNAGELLDLTGRHLRERTPQRSPFTIGAHVRDNRRGRTGLDGSILTFAGAPGFGFEGGEVWATHLAWSGNHRLVAERAVRGTRLLSGGELLAPGEMLLEPGQSYESPWWYGAYGDGITEASARFHTYLRSRPQHPRRERPVTINTWEAVYFDHDLGRLKALADNAARVGVERFVLDDGWFGARRNDRAGLGDWVVSADAWPDGLAPLIDHVRGLGMEFGIWVEPEMVNPDSDLARAHPEWILSPGGSRLPMSWRHQQVLDLTDEGAYQHVLGQLDGLLRDHDIAYLKWDHNRDLLEAGDRHGHPAVHRQTLAAYALMDELLRRHPGLEIESCSSGGGRVDLGVLERACRVWGSDCLDALERQQIQRWTTALIPWEMLGCHIGSDSNHTTGRKQSLGFRAATAFFGHFGIEWDLTKVDSETLDDVAAWVTAHQAVRPLLHAGRAVTGDHPDDQLWVYGVVAQDGGDAVFALAQRGTSLEAPTGRVRLPGLQPDVTYDVRPLVPGNKVRGTVVKAVPWWDNGFRASGAALSRMGLIAPTQYPEQAVLLRVTRAEESS